MYIIENYNLIIYIMNKFSNLNLRQNYEELNYHVRNIINYII